jgi:23S rRNA A2030 N6-methylase RlmJ
MQIGSMGCGLIVINPPYQFEDQGLAIASAVLRGLSGGEAGAGTTRIRLADE